MNEITTTTRPPRREFLFNAVRGTLSAAAVAALAGRPALALAAGATPDENDIRILATAVTAEREAVAAYGVAADSGLLTPPVLRVAKAFRDHHRQHTDALLDTIGTLGGTAPDEQAHDFPMSDLRSEADILGFAAGLERGAVSAYAGAIPLFHDRTLSKAAASILADEAMHWAILRQALGQDPVPGAFFS